MKKYLFLFALVLPLVNCQPKKTANEPDTISTDPNTEVISEDSVRPVVPPDRTVTDLDSTGDAAAPPGASLPSGSTNNIGSSWQITKGQIGPIRVGMPVTEMRKQVPAQLLKEVPITREGKGYKAYEIRQSGADTKAGLLVEEICEPDCKVWRIQVQNPAYKTKEGLGIGSTLADVKKHYKLSFLGAGETEIVAVSDDAKLTFMLDVSNVPPKEVPRLNLKNTPDSTPVIGMLVL